MRTNSIIAGLVWSGLILGTGMAWCQPATGKVESIDTQLPAVDSLPPAKVSALALEHFYTGPLPRGRTSLPRRVSGLGAHWSRGRA
jgi:hypothetical protein